MLNKDICKRCIEWYEGWDKEYFNSNEWKEGYVVCPNNVEQWIEEPLQDECRCQLEYLVMNQNAE